MSHKTRTLLTVISLALILSFFATRPNPTVTPALAAGNECDSSRTIQVSGSAVVKVVPDLVTIQLGVTSNDLTPQGVYDKNTAAIKKVTAAFERWAWRTKTFPRITTSSSRCTTITIHSTSRAIASTTRSS